MKITKSKLRRIIKEELNRVVESSDMSQDRAVKQIVRAIQINPHLTEEYLNAWEKMTTGDDPAGAVKEFSEAIGYVPSGGIFGTMPERGSEQEHLMSVVGGVRFMSRRIKSGVEYPTSEEISEMVTTSTEDMKKARAARAERPQGRPKYGIGGTHERWN
tara:strand:- start:336 stop:812 length:477 start_codon:yes stop_codon:yes gene_type:complete